jgi:hypothetical protein
MDKFFLRIKKSRSSLDIYNILADLFESDIPSWASVYIESAALKKLDFFERSDNELS